MTDGIASAGISTESAHLHLVDRLGTWTGLAADPEYLEEVHIYVDWCGFTALAAWEVGSCMQHRQTYYIFCFNRDSETLRMPSGETASASSNAGTSSTMTWHRS